MAFTDDTALSLQAAVAVVNTASAPDTMTTVADLDRIFEEFGYTGRRERTQAELDDVRAVRPRLRTLLTSDRDTAAGLVNDLLAEFEALPRLVRHDPYDWHIHAIGDDRPLAARMAVETAMAMIDVIREDELSRLGVCADDDCDGLVLDLSRNRSRRYCSVACSNRNAVAAYRARRSAHR